MFGMKLLYFMPSLVPKENIIWFFFIQIENATSDIELKKVIGASSDILIDNGITAARMDFAHLGLRMLWRDHMWN